MCGVAGSDQARCRELDFCCAIVLRTSTNRARCSHVAPNWPPCRMFQNEPMCEGLAPCTWSDGKCGNSAVVVDPSFELAYNCCLGGIAGPMATTLPDEPPTAFAAPAVSSSATAAASVAATPVTSVTINTSNDTVQELEWIPIVVGAAGAAVVLVLTVVACVVCYVRKIRVATLTRAVASANAMCEFSSAREEGADAVSQPVEPQLSLRNAVANYSAPPVCLQLHGDDIQLGRVLGEGSSGQVRFARLEGREIAVKMMQPDIVAQVLFRHEISLMHSLPQHPHVVALVAYRERPVLCLCFEYCSGGSLDVYLRAHQTAVRRALKWASQAANGVAHLHAHNIVHRDLATRNLLLTYDNVVKVADFGLSRVLQQQQEQGRTTSAVGPIRWMAYESLVDQTYSCQSDVWMFGVTLWEFVSAAKVPFAGLTTAEVAIGIVKNDLRLHRPECCPSTLYSLMQRCWQIEPSERPSFNQIAVELLCIVEQLSER
jgi:hypothetical protein